MSKMWLFGLLVIIADLISKGLTHLWIPSVGIHLGYPYGGIGVFENILGVQFSLIHVINKGAAWGILSNFQVPLLILRIFLITALVVFVLFYNKNREWQSPFILIIAGAIANVLDYFLYGHVIDMFHFVLWGYSFPAFNVADSAITIGIFWLILLSFLENPRSQDVIES